MSFSSLSQPTQNQVTERDSISHADKDKGLNDNSDNPCWGSPSQCSLEDLLDIVKRETNIIFESKDYVALNKPPDVRMDGFHRSTVHKLLTYWYPPPSLVQEVETEFDNTPKIPNDDTDEETRKDAIRRKLLQSKYHMHSYHPDNELRPTHQLDYATSGILLVARSRQAAAQARIAFDHRSVFKAYLALVKGKVSSIPLEEWPVLESLQVVKQQFATLEKKYRKRQSKRHKNTFQGYQPASSLFQHWQQQQKQRKRQLDKSNDKSLSSPGQEYQQPKKKRKQSPNQLQLTLQQWQRVWGELHYSGVDQDEFLVQADMNWKQVKQMGQTNRFERAAKVYNEYLVQHLEDQTKQDDPTANVDNANIHDDPNALPLVFRIRGDHDSFYIAASIAEVPNQFAVTLNPDESVPSYLSSPPPVVYAQALGHAKVSSEALNFKPSLTQCKILSESDKNIDGTSAAATTTKVLLMPLSGRRHQLRIHMALLGHSIVGDQTYNDTVDRRRASSSQRMCLHAHKLRIPLSMTNQKTKGGKTKSQADDVSEDDILELIAADPF